VRLGVALALSVGTLGSLAIGASSASAQTGDTITSAASATLEVGQAVAFNFTSTGSPIPNFTFAGVLPTGVAFSPSGPGSATLHGTPAAGTGGTYHDAAYLYYDGDQVAAQTFILTVDEHPEVSSAHALPSFTEGQAGTTTITFVGFPDPVTGAGSADDSSSPYGMSGTPNLPAGVTYTDDGNDTATVAGTPAVGSYGTYDFFVGYQNSLGGGVDLFGLQVLGVAPVITVPSTGFATVGQPMWLQFDTESTPTATLSVGGAALPSDVSVYNPGDGIVAVEGTPGAHDVGSYPLTITAVSDGASTTRDFTLTILPPPAITSADATAFVAGQPGTFTFSTVGLSAPELAMHWYNAPAGVTFTDNGNGTATLAGTVTTPHAYQGYFSAANAGDGSFSLGTDFTLNVDTAPVFTSAASTSFTAGDWGQVEITAPGTAPETLSVSSNLPGDLAFTDNGDGTEWLYGTPGGGDVGTYDLTITATNQTGTATQDFTLTVVGVAPQFVTPPGTETVATGQVPGDAGGEAGGTPTPTLSVTSGTVPGGMTFTDTGTGLWYFSGTPLPGTGGVYPVTVTASNGVGNDATQVFTITVDEGAQITTAVSTTFAEGAADDFTVTATGYPTPTYSVVAPTLAADLSFVDDLDGHADLMGSPTAADAGTYDLAITASNAAGGSDTQYFTLTIASAISGPAVATFSAGHNGAASSYDTTDPYATLSLAGTDYPLPSGMGFAAATTGSAQLYGTPASGSQGSYLLTLVATRNGTVVGTMGITLAISDAPQFVAEGNATSETVTNGQASSEAWLSTSGTPWATLSVTSGTLPAGMTFTDAGPGAGYFSGTPGDVAGTYSVTVTATNGTAPDATQVFTITVHEYPTITSASAASFVVGQAGSFTITTSGYPVPDLSLSGVPPGLTFVDSGDGTGTLSGTPAVGTAGTYYPTLQASSAAGSLQETLGIAITDAPPLFTGISSATFGTGAPFTGVVSTTSTAPETLTVTGTMPEGMTFTDNGDGTGTFAGTLAPGTGGSYPIVVTATNDGGSTTHAYTLHIITLPSITSADNTAFTEGEAGTFSVTDTAYPPGFLFAGSALTSTPRTSTADSRIVDPATGTAVLPAGVTFVGDTYAGDPANLAGTPALGSAGVYTFYIGAANGDEGMTTTQAFILTVLAAPVTPPAPAPVHATLGYALAGSDAAAYAFGGAVFTGPLSAQHLAAPVVGMAETPDGHGSWLVAADGGVFAYGDGAFYGSMAGKALNAPIVGMTVTPDGHGYWLVAADGGVFTFGDAQFRGSLGTTTLNAPVVGMAATATGYVLVAGDGGVFAFGTRYGGSMAEHVLTAPMVGIATTPTGGYLVAAADGGVFAFGGAVYHGTMATTSLGAPMVGIATTADGNGYVLTGSDGGVFAFGDAAFYGSLAHTPLTAPVVAVAVPHPQAG